jgi:2-keto-4-pentenoate hydratase/2-oxohepta-3-ene-1,7-dioic acid hydratase in catechol pathway
MKIVSYGPPRAEQPGILVNETHIIPLSLLTTRLGLPSLDSNALLAFLPYVQPLIEEALAGCSPGIDVKTVRLGPPVPRPEKIVVAGGNYRSHVDEAMGCTRSFRAPDHLQALQHRHRPAR